MSDPVAFTRELAIQRLLNMEENFDLGEEEGFTPEARRWIRRKGWQNQLRRGQMPDLSKYPQKDSRPSPSRAFLKGYFETVLKPPPTPEELYDKVWTEELEGLKQLVAWTRKDFLKATAPGAVFRDEIDWEIRREQYPEVSSLVEKHAKDESVIQSLAAKRKPALNRAFKLTQKIVRPENLDLTMFRPESREMLSQDPYLYSHISRPTSGVVRRSTREYENLTRDFFRALGVREVPEAAQGDYYPKYASITFKSLPRGIEAESPYQGGSGRFLPTNLYTLDYDKVANRSLYYVGDAGMSFWGAFSSDVENRIFSDKFRPEYGVLTHSLKPLGDLSNLFEHVLRELYANGDKIRMPGPQKAKETFELIVFGQMEHGADFF